MVFSSCEEFGPTKNSYAYHTSCQMTSLDHFRELSKIVDPKLNHMMELTKKEAETEWNSFYNVIKDIKVDLNDDEYYTVGLYKEEISGDTYVSTETVGSFTWGTKQ